MPISTLFFLVCIAVLLGAIVSAFWRLLCWVPGGGHGKPTPAATPGFGRRISLQYNLSPRLAEEATQAVLDNDVEKLGRLLDDPNLSTFVRKARQADMELSFSIERTVEEDKKN